MVGWCWSLSNIGSDCRPLKHEGAYLLITADTDEYEHDKLHLGLRPQDAGPATLAALGDCAAQWPLATVVIDPIEVCALGHWRVGHVLPKQLCFQQSFNCSHTAIEACSNS